MACGPGAAGVGQALLCLFALLACLVAPFPAAAQRDGAAVVVEAIRTARDTGWNGQATVSPERRVHILDGDARGGGHRPGRGVPGKSEFPRGWSDDAIVAAIEDVANDPASARRFEADGRTVVTGRRDGVDIRVVVERDGRSIVTGYPTNTPRNPP